MPPRIFLDTSAIFSALWSATGGGRELLKLSEANAIRATVSSHVLAETDSVVRRKAGGRVGELVMLLDDTRLEIVPAAEQAREEQSLALLSYTNDAKVIAAAWQAEVDYFVTLDRQHFLDNEPLKAAVPFPIGTPGDCLAWLSVQLSTPESE
ncbi:MAG: type II toxin-antitoxin system VapC family toxin [Chloroflexi bacterium]|nr:MAG: type II toxin-antitoxin system VapC family toxin [Chloroflexota bacterium]